MPWDEMLLALSSAQAVEVERNSGLAAALAAMLRA